jgi:glutathione S-transferase
VKLYGSTNKRSFNTLKIRAALAEAAVTYQFVPVDLDKGENKTPEFLALNPHGKIPVLTDGDFALPESNAILWYVAENAPSSTLVPRNDGGRAAIRSRARVAQWLDFAQTTLYAAYADWWTHALGDKGVPALAEAAIGRIHRGLGVMETVLATRPFIATPDFSMADLANASMIFALKRRLPDDPLAKGKYERVSAWYERLRTRPSFASAIAE